MKRLVLVAFVSFAALVSIPSGRAQPQLQPLWSLAPGLRPYLTTANQQRGMAYDPVTGNVLIVNRAGGSGINIIDGTTGADKGSLPWNNSLIAGGTLPVNMIGVTHNGVIYVGNLSANGATENFRLYRWKSEGAQPELVFDGNPAPGKTDGSNKALRFGDTLDVRGEGSSTQILLGSRGANFASILTTTDGNTFTAHVIQSDATGAQADNGPFGLGISFGAGDTFWGKSAGATPLREFSFDLGSSSAVTTGTWGAPGVPDSVFNIAHNAGTSAGHTLLAAIDDVNHTLFLYDVHGSAPVLLDVEKFPTANPNPNGTGAADFGGGKLFALDTNNGLIAFDIIPEPREYLLLGLGLAGLWWYRRHRGEHD